MGGVPAHKIVQRAINDLYPNSVIVNGELGLNVFNIANKLEPISLHKQIRIEAKKYYLRLIDKNKSFEKFKNGWLTRASW
jgi:lysozyme family protein